MSPENEKSRPGTRATGKSNAVGVAVSREPVDRRAAGVPETEKPRALVERLPRCVVERRAEPLGAAALANREEKRVSAAREQAGERRLDRGGLEVERGDVPLEMIDRDERDATRPRECLRGRDADEERSDQTRALGDRDALDLVERYVGDAEGVADDRPDELEVPPRRDLGHDAAEPRVEVCLRRNDGRQHDAVLGHDGGGGLVARRLDPEDHDACSDGAGSRHMMSASSRLSV